MANSIHSLLSNQRNKTFFVALGAGKSVDLKFKCLVNVSIQFCVLTESINCCCDCAHCTDLWYVCVYKVCRGKAIL